MTRHKHRGFTFIELLIVIGVIGLLVGIAVLGYQHFDKAAAEKSTRTRLEICRSLMSQYNGIVSLGTIEGPGGVYGYGSQQATVYVISAGSSATSSCGSPGDVTDGSVARTQVIPVTALTPVPTGAVSITGVFTVNSATTPPSNIYANAVQGTGMVFQQFERMPDLKNAISQLPGETFLKAAGDTTAYVDSNAKALPVLLDGWKNPIIYVPSGGMTVYIGGIVPNSGTTSTVWGTLKTVKSLDGRPFWASAGPDGNFSTGDDNLYSCPVTYQ